MDRMDGWTDGWNGMEWVDRWKPFPLQNEDSTGLFLRIVSPPRRIEDLRKEFLWNLQSLIQMQAGDCKFVSRYKEKSVASSIDIHDFTSRHMQTLHIPTYTHIYSVFLLFVPYIFWHYFSCHFWLPSKYLEFAINCN